MPKPASAMLVFAAEDVVSGRTGGLKKAFGRPMKERAVNVVAAAAAAPGVSKGSTTRGQRLDFDCTEKRVALVPLELNASMLAFPPAACPGVYVSSAKTPETTGGVLETPGAPAKPKVAKRLANAIAAAAGADAGADYGSAVDGAGADSGSAVGGAGADFGSVVDAAVMAEPKRARTMQRSRTAPAPAPVRFETVPMLARADGVPQLVRPDTAEPKSVRFEDAPTPLVRTDSVSQVVRANDAASRRMRPPTPAPAAMLGGVSSASRGRATTVGIHPLARAAIGIMLDPFYSVRMPYSNNLQPASVSPISEGSPSPEEAENRAMGRTAPPSEVYDTEYDPESPAIESPPGSAGSVDYNPERPAAESEGSPAGSASSGASGASSGTIVWNREPLYSPGNTDLNETPERDDGLGSLYSQEMEPEEQAMDLQQPEEGQEKPEEGRAEDPEKTEGGRAEDPEKLDHGVVTPTTAYIQSFLRRADSRPARFSPEVTTAVVAERAKAAAAVAGARHAKDAEVSGACLSNYATALEAELGDLISAAAIVSAGVDVAKDKFEELQAVMQGNSGAKIPPKKLAMALESVNFGRTTLEAMRRTVRVANLGVETASIALDTVEDHLKEILEGVQGGPGKGSGAGAGAGAAGGSGAGAGAGAAGGSGAGAGAGAAGGSGAGAGVAARTVRVDVVPDSEEEMEGA